MHAIEAGRVAQRVKEILDKELDPKAKKTDVMMAILAIAASFSIAAKQSEDEFYEYVLIVYKVMAEQAAKKR
jgi:hypothetical protein